MKNIFAWSIISLLITWLPATPQSEKKSQTDEPSILKLIQDKYSAKTTFEADFNVTIFWAVREKQEKRSGRLSVAPGDKFRVESGATTWVSDGTTYWQYSGKNNQVLIKRLLDVDISMLPSQLIAEYLAAFHYTAVQDMAERCILEGKPDSAHAQSDVASLLITIDKKNNTISRVFVKDKDSNTSTYTFKNARFGKALPPSVFKYTPPDGATVIDARE